MPVVAPIFLASHKPAATQKKKVAVGQDIPDVFSNRGVATPAPAAQKPSTSTPAAPPPPAPSPTTAPAPRPPTPTPAPATPVTPAAPAKPAAPPTPATVPIPVPAAPPPTPKPAPTAAQDIGEIFGQPGRKNWTPAEIAKKTSELPGVGGALIVLQDGLLVAAQLPPGLDGDTIAAFLPQMYGRMNQYCKELRFGDPTKMTFILGEMPLKIYRGEGLFFTVLGRTGEDLPHPQLDVIAAQLGSKSNA
jgi:predicted regulator of Ras-like GTPase activity (Roadblock/LC7/MglB family)